MYLCSPASSRTAYTLLSMFFLTPIPSGCTFMLVESILSTSTDISIIPFSCNRINAFCKTPFFVHRRIRTYTVFHFPYSLGKHLHLHPFSITYRIAFRISRLLYRASLRCFGNASAISSYCSFVILILLFYLFMSTRPRARGHLRGKYRRPVPHGWRRQSWGVKSPGRILRGEILFLVSSTV